MRECGSESAATLEGLLDRARYFDAYALVGGRDALVAPAADIDLSLAHARLARHLGSASLALALARRAHRGAPTDPRTRGAYARALLARRGGYLTLRWLEERGVTDHSEHFEDLLTRAVATLDVRDVLRAGELLERAAALRPEDPYVASLMAHALEVADRMPEARAAYEALCARHPDYPASAFGLVHVLFRMDERALGLGTLQAFATRTQSGAAQLELMHRAEEQGDFDLAREAMREARTRLPLASKREERTLLATRYRISYLAGDRDDALACLEEWNTPPARELAARTREAASVPGDVRLPVPRVAQGFLTCAPASLTAICRYFGESLTQDEVVAAICFGGTPAVRQRRYAATRGLMARTFDLSVDAGRALIDRGLPFALVTHGTSSSHLQVVVGYDPVRAAWLVMDPSCSSEVVLDWATLHAHEVAMGPEATVYCPLAEAQRLEGVELPGARGRALLAAVEDALEDGDFAQARAVIGALRDLDEADALSARAEQALAEALGDVRGALAATRRWLALFPTNARLRASVAALERATGLPINARVAHVSAWAEARDPGLLCEVARTLMALPSRYSDAGRLLRRATLLGPTLAYPLGCLAELALLEGRWEEAMQASRLALCLDEAYAYGAAAHAQAAARLGRRAEALAFLEAHATGVGERSDAPVRWLATAYVDAAQPRDALRVLSARAREGRQGDAALLIQLAELQIDLGEHDAARATVERAARSATVVAIAEVRARLAIHEDDLDGAQRVLTDALREAPWSVPLVREYAATLSRREGPNAARAWLREQALAQPGVAGIVEHACQWLRRDPIVEAEVLEAALIARPRDAWVKRELAITRSLLGRPREAEALLDEVLSLDALDPVAHRLRGMALAEQHRTTDALEAYQAALAIDPTDRDAMDGIAQLELSLSEKRAALERFVERLETGTPRPDDIHGVMPVARMLPPDEVVVLGKRLVERFPAVVTAHWAAAELALRAGREEVAEEHLRAALSRFPDAVALQQLELDLARGRRDYARALAISTALQRRLPLDVDALLDYVADLRSNGQHDTAEVALVGWRTRGGLSSRVDRALASLRARVSPAAALEALMPSLRDGSLDLTLWRDATDYARAARELEGLQEVLAELEARYPSHPTYPRLRAWASEGEPRREALERARELAPEDAGVLDELALYWAEQREYDRALAFCPPAGWQGEVPVYLQGRRADILARRGMVNAAIDEMMVILRLHPRYEWGLDSLWEWTSRTKRRAERIEGARLYLALHPTSTVAFSRLAESLLEAGESLEAIGVLRAALRRDPRSAYAAATLVKCLVESGRGDEARALLGTLDPGLSAGARLECQVRVQLASGDVVAALEAIAAALTWGRDAGLDAEDGAGLAEALATARGAERAVAALVSDALRSPAADDARVFWDALASQLAARWPVLLRRWVGQARSFTPAGQKALGRALLRVPNDADPRLRANLVARWRRFPREVEVWAAVGYLLVGLGHDERAARWTRDYAEIEGVEPWMLWNRLLACVGSGRHFAALDAARHALTLPPDGLRTSLEHAHALLSTLAGVPCATPERTPEIERERLLADALRLIQHAREVWDQSAASFAGESLVAYGELIATHLRPHDTVEALALDLSAKALIAHHARLASPWASFRYRQALRARARAAREGRLDA